jgi:hypothetical protein
MLLGMPVRGEARYRALTGAFGSPVARQFDVEAAYHSGKRPDKRKDCTHS